MGVIPAALKQQFLRVDKRYSINPNEEPFFDMAPELKLDKLEYTPPTEQEIAAEAEAEASLKFNEKKDKAEETYLKALDRISLKKQKALADYNAKLRRIEASAGRYKDKERFALLKRGLSRSSVFSYSQTEDPGTAEEDKAEAAAQYKDTLEQLQAEEQNALKTKDNALEYLQRAYQDLLLQLIAKKTQQAKDKQESVLKYNNNQAERQANYKRTWAASYLQAQQAHSEQAMKLQNVAIDQGYPVILSYIYRDKVTFAKDYYLGYDSARQAYDDFVSARDDFILEITAENYNIIEQFLKSRI